MEMLALAAVFFVSWFPARRLRQVLLVVFAPAIAYLFNLVRVGVLVVAPTSEFSTNHARQGLAVFFGAIVCVILLDRVLGRLLPGRPEGDRAPRSSEAEFGLGPESISDVEQGQQPEIEPESNANGEEELQPEAEAEFDGVSKLECSTSLQGSTSSSGRLGAASLVALAVAMLGVSIWMPRWDEPESRRLVVATLPAELDGWTKTQKIDSDGGFLWTVRFQKQEYWRYERNDDAVSVFIGYDDRSARGRSLLSRKNALPRRGWEVVERSSVPLEAVEARAERVVARSGTVEILTYHWYEGVNGLASEILRALLATDQSRFRRSQPARVIRVATVLGSTPLVRQKQEATLRAFASSFANALRE
jgi:EpsI family protein